MNLLFCGNLILMLFLKMFVDCLIWLWEMLDGLYIMLFCIILNVLEVKVYCCSFWVNLYSFIGVFCFFEVFIVV